MAIRIEQNPTHLVLMDEHPIGYIEHLDNNQYRVVIDLYKVPDENTLEDGKLLPMTTPTAQGCGNTLESAVEDAIKKYTLTVVAHNKVLTLLMGSLREITVC